MSECATLRQQHGHHIGSCIRCHNPVISQRSCEVASHICEEVDQLISHCVPLKDAATNALDVCTAAGSKN